MTPFQEACLLPVLFLTVVLLGGVRPGGETTLVPPSLMSLVAAVVLFALLVRSGALAPARLASPQRSSLANVNGVTALLSAFAATAQVLTLVVPPSGLPSLIVWTVVVALLAQALAVEPDRARLLRGLLILFGAAFTLKYIVLAGLSAPADSRAGRVFQLLFEGMTGGSVTQPPIHPAEGYLAFFTLVLYLVGIAWLPSANWRMTRTIAATTAVVVHEPDADEAGDRMTRTP